MVYKKKGIMSKEGKVMKKVVLALICSLLLVSHVWSQEEGGNPPGPRGGPGAGQDVEGEGVNPPGPKGGAGAGRKGGGGGGRRK